MKVTYRKGVPTRAALERIIGSLQGFRISDIYCAQYPRIIVSGDRGNSNIGKAISALNSHGIDVTGCEPSKGMSNGKIEIKPKEVEQ